MTLKTSFDPDSWIQGWIPDLKFYPVRPATYGANPYQPDPEIENRFEGMAQLKGGWEVKPARRTHKRRKRNQRR